METVSCSLNNTDQQLCHPQYIVYYNGLEMTNVLHRMRKVHHFMEKKWTMDLVSKIGTNSVTISPKNQDPSLALLVCLWNFTENEHGSPPFLHEVVVIRLIYSQGVHSVERFYWWILQSNDWIRSSLNTTTRKRIVTSASFVQCQLPVPDASNKVMSCISLINIQLKLCWNFTPKVCRGILQKM